MEELKTRSKVGIHWKSKKKIYKFELLKVKSLKRFVDKKSGQLYE